MALRAAVLLQLQVTPLALHRWGWVLLWVVLNGCTYGLLPPTWTQRGLQAVLSALALVWDCRAWQRWGSRQGRLKWGRYTWAAEGAGCAYDFIVWQERSWIFAAPPWVMPWGVLLFLKRPQGRLCLYLPKTPQWRRLRRLCYEAQWGY